MAGNIKGITVEIGGDTTKLSKALSDVNKQSKSLQSELRGIESLLKLDPTNTELLAQKQKVLAESIETSKQKLEALKSVQEQVNKQFQNGEIGEQQYRDFQREIEATTIKIQALEQEQRKLETSSAFSGLEKSLKSVNSESSDLQDKLSRVNEALKLDPTNTELLTQKQKLLSDAVETSRRKLEELQSAQDKMSEALKNGDIGEDAFADYQKSIEDAKKELQELEKELDNFGSVSTQKLAAAGTKAQELGGKIENAGETLAPVSAAAAAGLAAATYAANDLETAIDGYISATGTATSQTEQYKSVLQEIYRGGYGESFTDIAQAMQEVRQQAGDLGADEIKRMTENALLLRDTFDMDIAESTRAVTALMEQFGITADEAYNLIAQGAQNGLNQNGDLLDVINEYSVQFSAAGLSAEEMFNMIANGAETGAWSIDKMGDAFKEFEIRMNDGTAVEYLEQLGLNAEATISKFQRGGSAAKEAMSEIVEAILSCDDATAQYQAGVGLFGTMWEDMGIEAVMALTNTQGEIRATNDAIGQINETKFDNLTGQIEQLKRTFVDIGVQLGEALLPVIKNVAEWLQRAADKFSGMSDGAKTATVVAMGVAAALAPVLTVVGKVVSAAGTLMQMAPQIQGAFTAIQGAIGGISAPVVAVVAAVAALVAAFVHLMTTNEEFREKIIGIWENVKSSFEGFAQGIVDRLNALGFDFESITDVIYAVWDGFCNSLAPVFIYVFDQFTTALSSALDVIMGLLDIALGIITLNWDQAWTGVKEVFGGVWDFIVNTLTNVATLIWELIGPIVTPIAEGLASAWESVKSGCQAAWDGIVAFFTESIPNFAASVGQWFSDMWTGITQAAQSAWDSIVSFFTEGIPNFLNTIIEWFGQLPYNIGYIIGQILGSVTEWVVNMVNKAAELGSGFLNSVVEFFSQLPGRIADFITSAYNSVTDWAVNMINKAVECASGFLNNVINTLKNLPGNVKSLLDTIISNVASWASDMGSRALECAKNFISNVVNTLKNLPGNIKEWFDRAVDNAAAWVSSMGDKGRQAISDLISAAVQAARSIPSRMGEIGRNIVNGVWDGICAARDWFMNQVSSFFSGIVDGAKAALGIASPSRMFADEVGAQIPPGIGKGIDDARKQALEPLNRLFDDMLSGGGIERSISASYTAGGTIGNDYGDILSAIERLSDRLGSLRIYLDGRTLVGEVINDVDRRLSGVSAQKARGM